jgi:hypothetical protein
MHPLKYGSRDYLAWGILGLYAAAIIFLYIMGVKY